MEKVMAECGMGHKIYNNTGVRIHNLQRQQSCHTVLIRPFTDRYLAHAGPQVMLNAM